MTMEELLSTRGALEHPATRIGVGLAAVAVVGMLAALPLLRKFVPAAVASDIRTRTLTWAVLVPLTLVPILLMPLTAMLFAGVIGILCFREFSRATGLFREPLTTALVAAGIVGVTAVIILGGGRTGVLGVQAATLVLLCILNVFPDRPAGYTQRVALGVGAFMLFGVGLSRLGLLAERADYRPIAVVLIACVQLNDVFAYCAGKSLSGRMPRWLPSKLFPTTSPGKSVAGHLGAIALTTPLAMWLLHLCFHSTPVDTPGHLLAMALIISIGGQLGDLVISSVKRDVGIKDMGTILPGHGGILDRCNSLLMVIPAMFHFLQYFGA